MSSVSFLLPVLTAVILPSALTGVSKAGQSTTPFGGILGHDDNDILHVGGPAGGAA